MFIHVKVFPDEKRDEVVKQSETSFYVYVREPAEHNRANIQMKVLISKELKIPIHKLKIITGHHHSSKIVEVLSNA